jgi:TolA-binding protein
MTKFKTSFFGFHKRSVQSELLQLQSEHKIAKETLENDLKAMAEKIEVLKQDIQILQKGGREK